MATIWWTLLVTVRRCAARHGRAHERVGSGKSSATMRNRTMFGVNSRNEAMGAVLVGVAPATGTHRETIEIRPPPWRIPGNLASPSDSPPMLPVARSRKCGKYSSVKTLQQTRSPQCRPAWVCCRGRCGPAIIPRHERRYGKWSHQPGTPCRGGCRLRGAAHRQFPGAGTERVAPGQGSSPVTPR